MLWVSLGLRSQWFKSHWGSEETRHEAASCSTVVGWRFLQSPSSVFLISPSPVVQAKPTGCIRELILFKGKRQSSLSCLKGLTAASLIQLLHYDRTVSQFVLIYLFILNIIWNIHLFEKYIKIFNKYNYNK